MRTTARILVRALLPVVLVACREPDRSVEEGKVLTMTDESSARPSPEPAPDWDLARWSAARIAERVAELDELQRDVTQACGTERAFTGAYWSHKADGTYVCVVCGLPLYGSAAKFDSGSGWPSFWSPFAERHVTTRADDRHGMLREELLCTRCGAHLGHVFDDGPPPTGRRHCINSASLRFVAEGENLPR